MTTTATEQGVRMMAVADLLTFASSDAYPYGTVQDVMKRKTQDILDDPVWHQLDQALLDGTIDPVGLITDPETGGYKVNNGHHRIARAVMLGVELLPVVNAAEENVWEQPHTDAWASIRKTHS